MTASRLSVVPSGKTFDQEEPISDRIRRLQGEARAMAREHVEELEQALDSVHRLAEEVAEGGEAYPVGVRELARRLVEDSEAKAQTIEALLQREGR